MKGFIYYQITAVILSSSVITSRYILPTGQSLEGELWIAEEKSVKAFDTLCHRIPQKGNNNHKSTVLEGECTPEVAPESSGRDHPGQSYLCTATVRGNLLPRRGQKLIH